MAVDGCAVSSRNSRPHSLYWKDELVGTVTDVAWVDFPWAGGKIVVAALSRDVRAALEYIERESNSDDGLQVWPFADELSENWRIVKPDGEVVEIWPPIIDFATGFVTWR
jgi:hypothetical protein